jgi:hypothetical protein
LTFFYIITKRKEGDYRDGQKRRSEGWCVIPVTMYRYLSCDSGTAISRIPQNVASADACCGPCESQASNFLLIQPDMFSRMLDRLPLERRLLRLLHSCKKPHQENLSTGTPSDSGRALAAITQAGDKRRSCIEVFVSRAENSKAGSVIALAKAWRCLEV